MSELKRHELKTQRQLVRLITSHTKFMLCEICCCHLGKLVVIPVDATPDTNVIALCNDCMVSSILKQKQSFFTKCIRFIRTLQTKEPSE